MRLRTVRGERFGSKDSARVAGFLASGITACFGPATNILCGEKVINACPACNAPIIYPTAPYCHACGTGLDQTNVPALTIDHPSKY